MEDNASAPAPFSALLLTALHEADGRTMQASAGVLRRCALSLPEKHFLGCGSCKKINAYCSRAAATQVTTHS